MDLSQKEEECSEEVKSINATLISLRMAIGGLPESSLPKHLRESLSAHLSEAHDLVRKVTTSQNWFKNIKYLLPGSDLHKLKEKNTQLIQDIHLVNLHLNSRVRPPSFQSRSENPLDQSKSEKEDSDLRIKKIKTAESSKSNGSEAAGRVKDCNSNSKLFEREESSILSEISTNATVLTGDIMAHDMGDQLCKRAAFTVRFLFNQEVFDRCTKGAVHDQQVFWNEADDSCEFVVQRNKFLFLPKDIVEKISKKHLVINGKWEPHVPDASMITTTFDMNQVIPPPPWKFQATDLSTNGSYIIKAKDVGFYDDTKGVREIKGDFERLEKGKATDIEDGDVIAIVTKKSEPQELLVGFQLLVYKF